ncbi:flagellar biosynthesis repressor FlbT [Paracoccus sp. (in: a-proteobacteria)]|uniref:flagellar biosynthesis repressor FlbT n=1 Tax=Paracoccus sp. TaxID=267 RepID=UPI0028AF7E0F|nr:flagellar biosynthesis repressor FlbT [Paracoccus sp. (in: a-proteobacteria)]
MAGLLLKLSPKERVLINGSILENGDRRSKIAILTPNTRILRLRDAIHPADVNSPVLRICYICQLLLTGDADNDEGSRQALIGIEELSQVFCDIDSHDLLAQVSAAVIEADYYKAFVKLKTLLPREAKLAAIGDL